ncbi:hypothetical protein BDZ45DRAFT_669187, partial [Acephala macrosclerotiorum]
MFPSVRPSKSGDGIDSEGYSGNGGADCDSDLVEINGRIKGTRTFTQLRPD